MFLHNASMPPIYGVVPSKFLGVDDTGPGRLCTRVGLRVPPAALLFWLGPLCVPSGTLLPPPGVIGGGSAGGISSMIEKTKEF